MVMVKYSLTIYNLVMLVRATRNHHFYEKNGYTKVKKSTIPPPTNSSTSTNKKCPNSYSSPHGQTNQIRLLFRADVAKSHKPIEYYNQNLYYSLQERNFTKIDYYSVRMVLSRPERLYEWAKLC